MKRDVGAHMTLTVTEPAELIFSMAVASGADLASERLLVSLDGAAVVLRVQIVGQSPGEAGDRLPVLSAEGLRDVGVDAATRQLGGVLDLTRATGVCHGALDLSLARMS